MLKIRIGTRASKLALSQVAELKKFFLTNNLATEKQIEIVHFTTSGDKIQDRNLSEIGGKGLFIKELEEALIKNKIDIAVHSAKDVPPILHPNTEIAAFSKRFDARDCFISKKYSSIEELPIGAVIGTSSARRKAILLGLRPDLKIVNFRGNVDTRLKKVDSDEVDATILAICGLIRLRKRENKELSCPFGYSEINKIIEKEVMLPAGGQGALIIQVNKNNSQIFNLVNKFNNFESEVCIRSERAFLAELGASCSTPVSVHAWQQNNLLHLKTIILDYDGSESFVTKNSCEFNVESAAKLGVEAANITKKQAAQLLKKICNHG